MTAQTAELLKTIKDIEAANTAKDIFLSNMSHELRTPMHAIISFASLGIKRADANEPDKVVSYFQRIRDSGRRLMRLLNDLLDMAKLESGTMTMEFAHHDLSSLVRSCISEFEVVHQDKNISFKVHPSTTDTRGEFDANYIGQVVSNLLSNALRYTEVGGKVEVTISGGDSDLSSPLLHVSVGSRCGYPRR